MTESGDWFYLFLNQNHYINTYIAMSGSTEPQIHSVVRDKWLAVTLRHVVT